MLGLTYNPNILTKIGCLGGLIALPRTLILNKLNKEILSEPRLVKN